MVRRTAAAWTMAVGAGLTALTVGLTASAQAPPAATPPAAVAPNANAQRVPITTADGVELDGTYFRSAKPGRDSPCVLMVHQYGGDRSKSDWITLAQTLSDNGFAVLTFDLRGHGGSTQLSNPQTFWNLQFNKGGIKGGSIRKTSISSKDFKPSYFPFLVKIGRAHV